MRISTILGLATFGLSSFTLAAKSWSFEDATISVAGKGAVEPLKQQLTAGTPFTSSAISLPASSSLKLVLTTTEGKSGKKPHQAFLNLREIDTGLEESYPLNVKESGKAKVDLSQKDLPVQFLASSKPLKASIIIASFGSSAPYNGYAFTLNVESDSNAVPAPSSPERYTSKPEIRHIFRADPKSPPRFISIVFTFAVVATLPAIWISWRLLGGNVDHLGKAFAANPLAHGLFISSIFAMEGVFFLYYANWNLFQTLPVVCVVGVVAYISGSRALTEVQERRLAGER